MNFSPISNNLSHLKYRCTLSTSPSPQTLHVGIISFTLASSISVYLIRCISFYMCDLTETGINLDRVKFKLLFREKSSYSDSILSLKIGVMFSSSHISNVYICFVEKLSLLLLRTSLILDISRTSI